MEAAGFTETFEPYNKLHGVITPNLTLATSLFLNSLTEA
jgi:hypothetical protein